MKETGQYISDKIKFWDETTPEIGYKYNGKIFLVVTYDSGKVNLLMATGHIVHRKNKH